MRSLFPTTPHVHISSYPPPPYSPTHQSSVLHKSLSYLLLHALYLLYSQHWLLFWFYSITFPVEALEARPWPERKILKSGHSTPASKAGVTHLGLDAARMVSSVDVHSKFLFAISTYVSRGYSLPWYRCSFLLLQWAALPFDVDRRQVKLRARVQRIESQPSKIACSTYGVLLGERMRLYTGGGLAAVMVTGENIRNAMVDIQVSQTRLILPLPLSPSRYPLVQTTFFSLSLSFTPAALTIIPQSSSSSLHIPFLSPPRFLFARIAGLFNYMLVPPVYSFLLRSHCLYIPL